MVKPLKIQEYHYMGKLHGCEIINNLEAGITDFSQSSCAKSRDKEAGRDALSIRGLLLLFSAVRSL